MNQSVRTWERECARSTGRSRGRRELGPHPLPYTIGEWIVVLLVALVIVATGWLSLLLFGAAVWL